MKIRIVLRAAALVAVCSSFAAAQTAPAPERIPYPVPDNLRVTWEFDRDTAPFPLHHFEMAVDSLTAFAEVIPLQVTAATYQARIPTMTVGVHTIYVRACAATLCGPEVGLLVELDDGSTDPPPTDPYPRVRNLRIRQAGSPQ